MSLSAEEIQKSLEASMMSMQIQMENDHKILNEKIYNLEKLNMQKDEEIEKLKSNQNIKLINDLNSQIRELEALKGQIPPMQQPITQNFQLAPTNSIKYAGCKSILEDISSSFDTIELSVLDSTTSILLLKAKSF